MTTKAEWNARAREIQRSGGRAMAMVLCPTCEGRIPLKTDMGWADVKPCRCPDQEPIDVDDLNHALFGEPYSRDDILISPEHLRKLE